MKSIEENTTEDISSGAIDLLRAKQIVDSGDTVVLTAGIPSPHVQKTSSEGTSNMMRIAIVD